MKDTNEKPNLHVDDDADETSSSGSDSHILNVKNPKVDESYVGGSGECAKGCVNDDDTFHSCSDNNYTQDHEIEDIVVIDTTEEDTTQTTNVVMDQDANQLILQPQSKSLLQQQQEKQQQLQRPPSSSSLVHQRRPLLARQVSQQLSRQRSKFFETLEIPDTPAGWAVVLSAMCSALLNYEMQLQKSLTCPPQIFGQIKQKQGDNDNDDDGSRYDNINKQMQQIYNVMTQTRNSIFSRPIEPALFVGTRGTVASTAAYLFGGPSEKEEHPRVRQVLTVSQDGAKVAIDWELPPLSSLKKKNKEEINEKTSPLSYEERVKQFLEQPIEQPVILVLHGINNHANYGYMKSLMREFTNRGWVAAGMNYRGCGGIPLETPRPYTGAYTGDLREVVNYISGRLRTTIPTTSIATNGTGAAARSNPTKPLLFLVGNSIGANIVTKYLGEEGFSGSLPACIAGGVSLGNPLSMNATRVNFPMGHVLGLGLKKEMLFHLPRYRHMTNPEYRKCIRDAMLSNTLADIDAAMSPILIRNDPYYPFTPQVGYHNSVEEYWADASSYRMVQHISVPFLLLKSKDDFLCYGPASRKLSFCLENPNVMVAKTKCGGHLGWQERPPRFKDGNENSDSGILSFGSSWANVATADFIEAILKTQQQKQRERTLTATSMNAKDVLTNDDEEESMLITSPFLQSRL